MAEPIVFARSRLLWQGEEFFTGRWHAQDVLLRRAGGSPLPVGELDRTLPGEPCGEVPGWKIYPATYAHMLAWERRLAPQRRLVALHRVGYRQGFGAGNRIVISRADVPSLRDPFTFGGWDGIYRAMRRSRAPFWFVQQSIVRELIPEGVKGADHPGIGHTGGYGPRELLRAGLFAFASLGGYTESALPIGADADHAIVIGRDEEALAESLAFNKLALDESRDYTKFTVDTSHLFDFPASLGPAERKRLLGLFRGRLFQVPNVLPGRADFAFQFDEEEILRLGQKYWRACAVHKELYDHVAALRGGQPFDYELSLDETPEPTPPRHLLFYLVLLQEGMGLPPGGIASAGPNIGFTKRHDYTGDLQGALWPQVNATASILAHFGATLSVHSADGVRASTGKGPGVDAVLAEASGGLAVLKVADVYQEVLWQVLAASADAAERALFAEAWRRTCQAVRLLARVYQYEFAAMTQDDAQRLLRSRAGQERIAHAHGEEALRLAQGAIGYGLPTLRLAAQLSAETDPCQPRAEAELFRRFMFLTYRDLRQPIFQTLTRQGWQRLAAAWEETTLVRLRGMGWTQEAA